MERSVSSSSGGEFSEGDLHTWDVDAMVYGRAPTHRHSAGPDPSDEYAPDTLVWEETDDTGNALQLHSNSAHSPTAEQERTVRPRHLHSPRRANVRGGHRRTAKVRSRARRAGRRAGRCTARAATMPATRAAPPRSSRCKQRVKRARPTPAAWQFAHWRGGGMRQLRAWQPPSQQDYLRVPAPRAPAQARPPQRPHTARRRPRRPRSARTHDARARSTSPGAHSCEGTSPVPSWAHRDAQANDQAGQPTPPARVVVSRAGQASGSSGAVFTPAKGSPLKTPTLPVKQAFKPRTLIPVYDAADDAMCPLASTPRFVKHVRNVSSMDARGSAGEYMGTDIAHHEAMLKAYNEQVAHPRPTARPSTAPRLGQREVDEAAPVHSPSPHPQPRPRSAPYQRHDSQRAKKVNSAEDEPNVPFVVPEPVLSTRRRMAAGCAPARVTHGRISRPSSARPPPSSRTPVRAAPRTRHRPNSAVTVRKPANHAATLARRPRTATRRRTHRRPPSVPRSTQVHPRTNMSRRAITPAKPSSASSKELDAAHGSGMEVVGGADVVKVLKNVRPGHKESQFHVGDAPPVSNLKLYAKNNQGAAIVLRLHAQSDGAGPEWQPFNSAVAQSPARQWSFVLRQGTGVLPSHAPVNSRSRPAARKLRAHAQARRSISQTRKPQLRRRHSARSHSAGPATRRAPAVASTVQAPLLPQSVSQVGNANRMAPRRVYSMPSRVLKQYVPAAHSPLTPHAEKDSDGASTDASDSDTEDERSASQPQPSTLMKEGERLAVAGDRETWGASARRARRAAKLAAHHLVRARRKSQELSAAEAAAAVAAIQQPTHDQEPPRQPAVAAFMPSPLLPRSQRQQQRSQWLAQSGEAVSDSSDSNANVLAVIGRLQPNGVTTGVGAWGTSVGGSTVQGDQRRGGLEPVVWGADLEDAFQEFQASVLVDRPESYTASSVAAAHANVRTEDFLRSRQFKAWFTSAAPAWLVKAQAMRLTQALRRGESVDEVRAVQRSSPVLAHLMLAIY